MRKEGRGGRRDEEGGWTWRKERCGGRSDEDSEKNEIIERNEKDARGRIVDHLGLVFLHSHNRKIIKD